MSEPVSALGQDAAPELLGPSLYQTLSPPSLESAPPNQYPQANENNLQPSNSISAQTSPPLDPPLDLSPTLTPRSPEPVALVTRGSQSSLLNPPNIISDLASLVDRSQLQRLLDLQRSMSVSSSRHFPCQTSLFNRLIVSFQLREPGFIPQSAG